MTENETSEIAEVLPPDKSTALQEPQVLPQQFRRDIILENVVLDRDDLEALFKLIGAKTEDARKIQVQFENPELFKSEDEIKELVSKYFLVTYRIRSEKTSIAGHGIPDFEQGNLPTDLVSVYISNSETFAEVANGGNPRNYLHAYIEFVRPPLAFDFYNMPSNPTKNGSVINVFGFNEDWVIATQQKLEEFFESKKSNRGFIHKSGAYDLLLYLIYVPIIIWIAFKIEQAFPRIYEFESTVLLVAVLIYAVLISLLVARFLFQYIRWLFPPVEFIPRKTIRPLVHKGVLGFVLVSIGLAFLYDILRLIISAMF